MLNELRSEKPLIPTPLLEERGTAREQFLRFIVRFPAHSPQGAAQVPDPRPYAASRCRSNSSTAPGNGAQSSSNMSRQARSDKRKLRAAE
jgi:hypothetical protein